MRKISLTVNGTKFVDWHSVRVTRSLEYVPWEFELAVENPWRDDSKRRIARGDAVKLYYGDELLLTGYVDDIDAEYDANSHRLTVRGRSKVADLVDCSGFDKPFNGLNLADIATQLCQPFGISVIDSAKEGKAFTAPKITSGETYFEFLEELARMRAVRLCDSPTGDLVLCKKLSELSGTVLALGRNIVKSSGKMSARELFSRYHLISNNPSPVLPKADDVAHPYAADEDVIKRFRQIVVVAGFEGEPDDLATRANLQKRVHRGRSESHTYTVLGWDQDNGQTWRPGMRVRINDPYANIKDERTIMETVMSAGEDGAKTEITVMPNYVLDQLPVPDDANGDWGA
jgi:prophage tail gpP-like protein